MSLIFFIDLQESKNDKDIESLFRICELVTELKDSEIPKLQSLNEINFPKFQSDLQVADAIFEKLVNKRLEFESKSFSCLGEERKKRAEEWISFVDDVSEKMKAIDKKFEEKELALKSEYANSKKFLEDQN